MTGRMHSSNAPSVGRVPPPVDASMFARGAKAYVLTFKSHPDAVAGLGGCVDAASDRDRQLLEQRYRDDACRRSMATALGVGETAIKQALRRARRRLQDCVRNKLDDQTTS